MTTRRRQRSNEGIKSTKAPLKYTEDRKRRRLSAVTNGIVCPVCTVTVRGDEKFHEHYTQEIERAKTPFTGVESQKRQERMRLRYRKQKSEECFEEDEFTEEKKSLDERTKELRDSRKRRYDRYAEMFLMSMKRKKTLQLSNNNSVLNQNSQATDTSVYELITCAVCNEFLEVVDSNRHLAKCFAKHDYQFELYSSSEEEENEEDEITWGPSVLDSEHYRREGRLTRLVMEDGDEELDIDGEEEFTQFGKQQYLFIHM
jgi:hypothetical protein